jgi:hypothetical protein
MNKFLLALILLGGTVCAAEYFLPEDFAVYTDGDMILNWQLESSFEKRDLPTVNHYEGLDGGYVAIFTRDEDAGAYSVGDGIYVMGQIRVQGHYEGRIFIPIGYSYSDNITQDPELLAFCSLYFPEKAGRMWVGGDTGGWFGIE